ncbi:Transmembrane protein 120B-B,Transmembrane protein 120 homolog,Transmembrane protein 120B-A,Transmembrane protein 120B,Transmembrane protein 120A [Lepeophtheirus salmonis]|uniref:Transmembrane protein 120B-B,Transmembrane protein 120 homolog,Transmembrane protein 120B-A,Transmembrane protein 120B,Transmembrane protein 120A n=1 Tax=Lepeophtheirus salmonis TaxID=72036 RepID=A0A7R8CSS9_LEPSM|nr:Transmembrane protein 120B-B,Transmembrane protein 120 homolog,Transmembrane protein 120B-A,Transmembrane protein 120B,Transmembrane protein 120A [Lepeophtheirus salmonis]CAF2919670.1 Transmembrane protein 120B-B,Transmembrane protein 120 homolog,Transmembrane protein 120B-A,Transmembrane protein 120B,Transmembrane protein 120A [Lepeophtheirus salmonis]
MIELKYVMSAVNGALCEYLEMEEIVKDWNSLSTEFGELDIIHKDYLNKFQNTLALQKRSNTGITHQRYRLQAMEKELQRLQPESSEEKDNISDLRKDILRRYAQLSQMEDNLPRQSGMYLKIILGNVNVSILDTQARFNYKHQYEQFKLIVVLIGCVIAVSNLYFNNRILDLIFMFLIVWYYCTLTIRESILKVNGSRIKGWWRLHHFISTIVGGVLLVWPDGESYQYFRPQLMYFNVYLALIQYMQFTYQRGCLYRLRSLGEQNAMDITVEGFHSWMWKGMGFLLPFLSMESSTWQVPILSLLFLVLGAGNIITTSLTVAIKFRDRDIFFLYSSHNLISIFGVKVKEVIHELQVHRNKMTRRIKLCIQS